MSYPWTTAQIDAIGRLAQYNGNPYNATTNPKGFAQGGHRIVFAPALNDSSTAIGAIKDAADFVADRASAAATAASDANQAAAKLSGTSTTSVVLGAGTKTFTTQAGKFFEPGRTLRIASAANPNTAYMVGKVASYAGTTLSVSVLLFVGTGSPADWTILVDGELGPSGTIAFTGVTSLAPDQAPTVTNTGTASAAQVALGIPRGMPAGLFFRWSTNTTATDPTTGMVKVGSASLTTATSLYISETDANAVAQSAVIASWDDSTNPVRGQVRIEDIANPANFVVYDVTGPLLDNGAWNTLPVAYVDKGGTLTNAASVRLEYRGNGNKGTDGLPGTPGAAATIAVESTDTGAAGSAALVENIGTTSAARFKFTVPRGATGAVGPVVATRYNFDTVTADADPSNGNVRFNNAAPSSVTQIFLDNVEAVGGISMTGFIDTFDDSTNPSGKGTLTFKDVNDPSKQVIYNVTGAVVDGAGYRKVPVTWIAGNGGFTAGANLGMTFDRAGDKGSDGNGAGDVVGPATSTDGGFALFNGTSGKIIQSAAAPGALAYRSSINGTDWSGSDLGIADGGTGASTAAAARTNLGVAIGSDVQGYSGKLAAIDGLTWAANQGLYLTGTGTVATYSLTAFARGLDGSADAAAAQTVLQLRPGVEVQAFDSDLAAIAALTTTSFGRARLTDADAPATRTALALGTAALANTGTGPGNVVVLDANSQVLASLLPSIAISDVFPVASQAAMLALNAQRGDVAIRSDINATFILATESPGTLADWKQLPIPTDAVLSVAGLTGVITGAQLKAALAYTFADFTGALPAANAPAHTGGDVTSTAGSLVLSIAAGVVTYAKLAAVAIGTAAEIFSNAASKLVSVSSLWSAQAWTTIASSATPTIDGSTGLNFKITLNANTTFQTPTNMKAQQSGLLKVTSGGAFTASWSGAFNWGSAGVPTLSQTAGKVDYLTYAYDTDTGLMVMGLFSKAA